MARNTLLQADKRSEENDQTSLNQAEASNTPLLQKSSQHIKLGGGKSSSVENNMNLRMQWGQTLASARVEKVSPALVPFFNSPVSVSFEHIKAAGECKQICPNAHTGFSPRRY